MTRHPGLEYPMGPGGTTPAPGSILDTPALFDYSIARFTPISLPDANVALAAWNHKMGVLHRGTQGAVCHGLFHREELVAVTTVSLLIREADMQGFAMVRSTCCELSRLCAARPGLCRVALRLWREFVFPSLGYQHAISYQDADLHSGNTYRFDGWKRIAFSHSGTDAQSGRKGRRKWIWAWPPSAGGLDRAAVINLGADTCWPADEHNFPLACQAGQQYLGARDLIAEEAFQPTAKEISK